MPDIIKTPPERVRVRSKRYDRFVILYLMLLLLGLTFPFSFRKPDHFEVNHLDRSGKGNGLEFSGPGIILSPSPPRTLHAALVAGNGFSLETWMIPEEATKSFFGRIVSYSLDPYLRNFTIGQQGRNLFMRLRTTRTNLDGSDPELVLKDALIPGGLHQIVVTYDFVQERIYIDGRLRLEASTPGGDFSNWDPACLLVLGNEATGNRPWRGRLFRVAIYDRPLESEDVARSFLAGVSVGCSPIASYSFDRKIEASVADRSGPVRGGDLMVPGKFRVWDTPDGRVKRFLGFSPELDAGEFRDVLLNILAFVALGFLLHGAVAGRSGPVRKAAVAICLFGFLFSFGIESLQYYLDGRNSDLIDIVSNTGGILIGILLEKGSSWGKEWRPE